MQQDQKTVVLIILIAFVCVLAGIVAPPIYKSLGLSAETVGERGNLAAGLFLALLARTRTEAQAVTVQQPASDPIPTVETKKETEEPV